MPVAIAELGSLVRIPSVSWDGFDAEHVATSAAAVKVLLDGLDVFDSVEIATAPIDEARTGHPALLATRQAKNGKPTILLYAHHDVQPPGNPEDWISPPFEPTVRGDRLYGRGAADDKAGVMAHIGAIRALVETVGPDFDLGLVRSSRARRSSARARSRTSLRSTASTRSRRHRRCRLRQLGCQHPGADRGPQGQRHVQAHGLDARARLALRHVRRRRSRRDARDGPAALHPSRRRRFGRRAWADQRESRDARVRRAEAARGSRAPRWCHPDRQRRHPRRIWYQPSITVTGIDAPTVANASNTLAPTVSVRSAPGSRPVRMRRTRTPRSRRT